MIVVLYIVGGLVGLVAMLALIGMFLPRGHVAARTARLARPPDEVWRALTDLDAAPGWRSDLKRLERLPDRDGKPAFREHTRQGAITYVIDEETAPPTGRRIGRIDDDGLPYGGRWIYELVSDGDATRLTITEDGFIKNPVFRVLSRTVFSTTATVERYLRDLGAHLGVDGTPAVAEPSALTRR